MKYDDFTREADKLAQKTRDKKIELAIPISTIWRWWKNRKRKRRKKK